MPQRGIYITVDAAGERDIPALTDRVAAGAKAALDWGADRVAVACAAGVIEPLRLPIDAEILDTTLPCGGLDDSFVASVLFGPAGGMPAWTERGIASVKVGGIEVCDCGTLTAISGGTMGIPVAAAIGGDRFVNRIKALCPETASIAVATYLPDGSRSAPHPHKVHRQVTDGLLSALRRLDAVPPLSLREPVACEIGYLHTGRADTAALVPGVDRIDTHRVSFCGDFKAVMPLLALLLYHL